MSDKPPQSKWHEFKKQSEAENHYSPIDNEAKIKRHFNDTQIGSPVDTQEEVDAQLNNLGPNDTKIEKAKHKEELEPPNTPRPGN